MSATVLVAPLAPGVASVTINRPERRNAIDRATYRALIDALAAAERDDDVRAVVLTGAGGCFTSGNDLADFIAVGAAGLRVALDFLQAAAAFPKPLVAAVEGFAVGIGTTILLHCDLAVAGAGATFRLPFATLGLVPEGASSLLLPRVAGAKRAAELLMLGEPFGPDAAREAGLVNAVTEAGGALALATERATALARQPADAIRATKALLRRESGEAVRDAIEEEGRAFAERLASPDAQAALAAFFRRR